MNHSIYEPAEDSILLSNVLKEKLPIILSKNPNLSFLEIGVGSGIQLQTAFESGVKKENILGVDLNPEAVKHCKSEGFNCIESNLFKEVKGRFDVVVFNAPYLPEDKNEPSDSKLATTGGVQGGEIVNKFLKSVKTHLLEQGRIFLVISNLTKGIDFENFKSKILAKEKVFFEELRVLEIKYEKTQSIKKKICS